MNNNITEAWRRLLLEVELAKHYPHTYLLHGGHAHHDPLLDYLLPSLLYVKSVSVIDEALIAYINNHALTIPRRYYNSLHGRIEFLSDQGILAARDALLAIKDRRNDIAHTATAQATWDELNWAVNEIEKALQGIGLVSTRPVYEFHTEKSEAKESTEPGVLFTEDYFYVIKENGKRAVQISWTSKILKEKKGDGSN